MVLHPLPGSFALAQGVLGHYSIGSGGFNRERPAEERRRHLLFLCAVNLSFLWRLISASVNKCFIEIVKKNVNEETYKRLWQAAEHLYQQKIKAGIEQF
jgi:hypothetical protein